MGSSKDSISNRDKPQLKLETKEIKLARPSLKEASPTMLSRPIHYITKARTQLLILLVVLYLAVNHFNLFAHPTNSLVSDIRMMIFTANLVVVYLGVLFLPEPSKKRGSGTFWKLI